MRAWSGSASRRPPPTKAGRTHGSWRRGGHMDELTRHLLDRITRGETYQAALELAGLFLSDEPSQYPREALARHLVALCSNRHGSFNWATDTLDLMEELREHQGLPPRRVASETTVRRHLRNLSAAEVEDL